MVLCDAGPKGGSAYLPMGAERSSLSPEDPGHQLAGLRAVLPNPQALICQEGQQAGRVGSWFWHPHLSLRLSSVCPCQETLRGTACGQHDDVSSVAVDLLLSHSMFICICVSVPKCHM